MSFPKRQLNVTVGTRQLCVQTSYIKGDNAEKTALKLQEKYLLCGLKMCVVKVGTMYYLTGYFNLSDMIGVKKYINVKKKIS